MIAALGNFDVRGMFRRGQNSWRQIVVEKHRWLRGQNAQFAMHGFQDAFHFAGSHDRVHFRHLSENLVAVAFDEASCNDKFFRRAEFFVLRHLENGVNGFLLSGFNEAAGVDHKHVGFVCARRQFVTIARKNAHHHLAIDKVLGASQADKSDFRHGENCAFSQFSIVARALAGLE